MTEPSDDLIAEFASRFIDERDDMDIQSPDPTLDEIQPDEDDDAR